MTLELTLEHLSRALEQHDEHAQRQASARTLEHELAPVAILGPRQLMIRMTTLYI